MMVALSSSLSVLTRGLRGLMERVACLVSNATGGCGPRTSTGLGHALLGVSLVLMLARSGDTHAADGKSALDVLRPTEVRVTAGGFAALLDIHGFGPTAGVEVGWRTGATTSLVVNVGGGPSWIPGSVRVYTPVGLSLRVLPWERGPLWLQGGIGSVPFLETIRVALPDRTVSSTAIEGTLTAKLAVGVRVAGWELGVGNDANLLSSQSYTTYTGDRLLPWDNTVMVWIGRQVWTRRTP